jgi:hypothetical protein
MTASEQTGQRLTDLQLFTDNDVIDLFCNFMQLGKHVFPRVKISAQCSRIKPACCNPCTGRTGAFAKAAK